MKPLLIYLADLTHTGSGLATEGFPLNIGLIASYAKKHFGNQVSIRLFKLPETLKSAIIDQPPDILGCSNYTWNSNPSYYFIQMAKRLSPFTWTVFGGTNYPFAADGQESFLRSHPDLDLHIFYEGEIAFLKVIQHWLEYENNGFHYGWIMPIDGCQSFTD